MSGYNECGAAQKNAAEVSQPRRRFNSAQEVKSLRKEQNPMQENYTKVVPFSTKPTESQQAAEAAVSALVSEVRSFDDPATAAAHALHVGVPALAALDPARRAVWSGELLKAARGLEAEELRAGLAEWDRKHPRPGNNGGRIVELVPYSTIEPCRATFAWKGRIVAADLNLLAGPPGVGKSTAALHLAACLTRGALDGDFKGKPVDVIVASAEDNPAFAIAPRLLAAGANMARVYDVRVKLQKDDTEDGLTLPDDVAELTAQVEAVDAALVIVDPITAHLASGVDSHKDASIRQALAPLSRMAHETGAAVLGIAHLNKAAGGDWVRRVGGSVGLGAAARNVLIAADDPDGDDRLIVHAKSNTGALAPTLRYRIEGRKIEHSGETIDIGGVAWLGEAEGVTATDVLADREEGKAANDAAAAALVFDDVLGIFDGVERFASSDIVEALGRLENTSGGQAAQRAPTRMRPQLLKRSSADELDVIAPHSLAAGENTERAGARSRPIKRDVPLPVADEGLAVREGRSLGQTSGAHPLASDAIPGRLFVPLDTGAGD